HVVEVYDHGVSEDGRPFIVMEYLEGEPLDKRLDRLGRLPAKDTAHIILQVCRALMKAHAANIVHRDLKPENVFLVWDDEEVTDIPPGFDAWLAKALSREPSARFASAAQSADSLAAVCGLSVRGSYVSTEMPRMSDGGTGPYGAVGTGPQAAFSTAQGAAQPY